MSIALPAKIGARATRALAHAGIGRLDDLVTRNESDIAALHGMEPKAPGILHQHVAAAAGFRWSGDKEALAVDAYLPDPVLLVLRTL